jgi:hypothetical protein
MWPATVNTDGHLRLVPGANVKVRDDASGQGRQGRQNAGRRKKPAAK